MKISRLTYDADGPGDVLKVLLVFLKCSSLVRWCRVVFSCRLLCQKFEHFPQAQKPPKCIHFSTQRRLPSFLCDFDFCHANFFRTELQLLTECVFGLKSRESHNNILAGDNCCCCRLMIIYEVILNDGTETRKTSRRCAFSGTFIRRPKAFVIESLKQGKWLSIIRSDFSAILEDMKESAEKYNSEFRSIVQCWCLAKQKVSVINSMNLFPFSSLHNIFSWKLCYFLCRVIESEKFPSRFEVRSNLFS